MAAPTIPSHLWLAMPKLAMQDMVEAGLTLLGEMARPLCHDASPCRNSGEEYENETFALRAYCWCDGGLHPHGCPPNFEYKPLGFTVRWYKCLGRGVEQNMELTSVQWLKVVQDCLKSIESQLDRLVERADRK